MEVRARRNPHEMPDPDDVTDIPIDTSEAWTTGQHEAIENKMASARKTPSGWEYPVKPMFLS